ncbi:MAG: GH92 family glycosyl hydrolase [Bacteroidales bacterium]|nr:GH92 family glycosyl hydrolase [Bacteroidales bacterium]
MKYTRFAVILTALCLSIGLFAQKKTDYAKYVNPLVGTDFHGHTYPGAVAPFGMVQLSPDTRLTGWDGCSAYHYSDTLVYGFSHTHLSGTGCSDYGDILLMPVTGYQEAEIRNDRYRSAFRHETETASPGYYSVFLDDYQILVELTAGPRTGLHRYTFEKGATPQVVLDLIHRDELLDSELKVLDDHTVQGMRRSKAWSEDQPIYFHLEFSRPIVAQRYNADSTQVIFEFAPLKRKNILVAKVGISNHTCENARTNLYAELPKAKSFDFDGIHKKTRTAWNEYLGKIEVGYHPQATASAERDSLEQEYLRTFYTALYHTAVSPNLYSDAGTPDEYTVFSLWDTFRALHPLFALIERERTEDFMDTFLIVYDQLGKLPMWELSRYETDCMIGYNSVSVIADALAKGITDFDVERMFEAMIANSHEKEYGIDVFHQNGLVLGELEHESVSKTLEYAYDDWCIAQTALYLYNTTGDEKYQDYYREYMGYAQFYQNVFDPSTGFMRARQDGRWMTPFRPAEVNNHYTEANSWQYSFFVPHDMSGHIRLLGGDQAYCEKLDQLFTANSRTVGRTQVDITGLIGQYAHGNEPSHNYAYLYTFAGQPWKTQARVREILTTLYDSSPDGLCGNEDCGQMSAWYVFSAMGFYPVTPGYNQFVLGAPLFDYVVLHLENGREFRIEANQAVQAPYVQGLSLNGQPHNRMYLTTQEILNGGVFRFELGETPNYEFGTRTEERPHTALESNLVGNPWFEVEVPMFDDQTNVSIGSYDAANEIWYAIIENRGAEPKYQRYTGPFVVNQTCILRAYAVSPGGKRSFVSETTVTKLRSDRSINILSEYNPQYNAGGDRGLVDGVRGRINWRTGGWQGFQRTDFEAIVDIGSVQPITAITAGFLQDVRSWIWMPTYVEFYISEDGEHFTPLGRFTHEVSIKDYEIQVMDIHWEATSTCDAATQTCSEAPKGRYVKVFAKNYGVIPEWHLGAGGQTFIFIDEIDIKN